MSDESGSETGKCLEAQNSSSRKTILTTDAIISTPKNETGITQFDLPDRTRNAARKRPVSDHISAATAGVMVSRSRKRDSQDSGPESRGLSPIRSVSDDTSTSITKRMVTRIRKRDSQDSESQPPIHRGLSLVQSHRQSENSGFAISSFDDEKPSWGESSPRAQKTRQSRLYTERLLHSPTQIPLGSSSSVGGADQQHVNTVPHDELQTGEDYYQPEVPVLSNPQSSISSDHDDPGDVAHSPSSAWNSAVRRSSAFRDETQRRDWAPSLSPLQKLMATFNDISKEEKRRRFPTTVHLQQKGLLQ
jgi:hypothetical protein